MPVDTSSQQFFQQLSKGGQARAQERFARRGSVGIPSWFNPGIDARGAIALGHHSVLILAAQSSTSRLAVIIRFPRFNAVLFPRRY